jgi:hypothetical protein
MNWIIKEKNSTTFLHLHGLPSRGGTSSPGFQRKPLMRRPSGHRHGGGGAVAWLKRWGGGVRTQHLAVRPAHGTVPVPAQPQASSSGHRDRDHHPLRALSAAAAVAGSSAVGSSPATATPTIEPPPPPPRRQAQAGVACCHCHASDDPPSIDRWRCLSPSARSESDLGIDHHLLAYLTDPIGSGERDWWCLSLWLRYGGLLALGRKQKASVRWKGL